MELCARCSKPGRFRCSRCGSVAYCGSECQTEHWKRGHKGQCNILSTKSQSTSDRAVSTTKITKVQVPDVPLEKWLCSPERVSSIVSWEPSKEVFDFTGVGIVNMGNTCFANCILQCLTYSLPFCLFMQSKQHRSGDGCTLQKQGDFCTLCEMENWVELLTTTTSDYVVRPIAILKNLKKLKDDFVFGVQEDANEFLYALVEGLQKSFVANAGRKVTVAEEDTTFAHQLFGGYKCLQIKCLKCDFASELKSFEFFLTLPLVLNGKQSIEELILNYFHHSQVIEGRKCETSGCTGQSVMDLFIYRGHPLLILQLMRFDAEGRKLNHPVTFREEVSLNPFKHPKLSEEDDLDYELYGVVVHYGNSLRSGHFVCFVKVRGQWFLCDDEKITPVSPSIVMKQMAYLLFFKKKRNSVPLRKSAEPIENEEKLSQTKKSLTSSKDEKVSKSLTSSSSGEEVKERSVSKKKLKFDVAYRLNEEESFKDFVVKINVDDNLKWEDITPAISANGDILVECGAGIVDFTIPFGLTSEGAYCKYYIDRRLVVCVIPYASMIAESSGEEKVFRNIPVVVEKGDVTETVSEGCTLDLSEPEESNDGIKQRLTKKETQTYDWNKEASYRNLYDEVKKQAGVLKEPIQQKKTAVKTSKPEPKRNDKCPCGSGKKYKNCHLK